MIERYRNGVLPLGQVDPALERDFAGLGAAVASQIDRAELTSALDEIWQRVRRLNRYVEEQAPWQLAKDEARAGELDRVLRTLAEGLRSVTVLLYPYLPATAARLLDALGAPELSLAGADFGLGAIERVNATEPLFPKDRGEGGGGGPGRGEAAEA
jgi:methionyl-tRNA synthetase